MLSYSDLRKGIRIILDNEPYEILEASSQKKARGQAIVQAKIKNLITGHVLNKTFRQADTFEEAELKKIKAKFIYAHREHYYFCEEDNPSKRFDLSKEQIEAVIPFLIPQQPVEGIIFNQKIINISLPIKITLKVKEAPPGVKGDRSQSGNKLITLESGAKINAPLFIEQGDLIEINTETKEYVQRIKKR